MRSTCATRAWRWRSGPRSPSWEAAEAAGLAVATVAEAVSGAQVVSFLLPDGAQPRVYEGDVLPNLDPSAALLFAHGFNVHYGRVAPPPGHDVIMVAPKGPGHVVRRLFEEGFGTPALVAVAQDASVRVRARSRLRRRDRRCAGRDDPHELRGGDRDRPVRRAGRPLRRRHRARPRGLRDARRGRYQPEIACYECLHELKLIVDLMGGRSLRDALLDLRHAEYGDSPAGRS